MQLEAGEVPRGRCGYEPSGLRMKCLESADIKSCDSPLVVSIRELPNGMVIAKTVHKGGETLLLFDSRENPDYKMMLEAEKELTLP
jgi:hypothetical protein